MTMEQTIEIWFHYEEIAMHFNQLIIQYRLQLMGGVGAIGALSGYLIGSGVKTAYMRHKLRALVSGIILVLFSAAAYLDLCYYNELLRGAVAALIRFESEHPELYMSTYIQNQFPSGASGRIYTAYGLVFLPLLVFAAWSIWVWLTDKRPKSDESHTTGTSGE